MIRVLLRMLAGTVVAIVLVLAWLWPRHDYAPVAAPAFELQRLGTGPVIEGRPETSLTGRADYPNINGPSLIRVPEWIADPLGKYYLYFAHHKGQHIRMAYADELGGPWTLYERGTLQLAESGFPTRRDGFTPSKAIGDLWNEFPVHVFRDILIMARRTATIDADIRRDRSIPAADAQAPHIASPDVSIDHANRQLRMYYHGQGERGYQYTRMAVSADGLNFTPTAITVPAPYVRAFEHRDTAYLLAMPGIVFRQTDDGQSFVPRRKTLFPPDMRHSAVWVQQDILHVIWTRVGDAPETLLYSRVELHAQDWNEWQASAPVTVLEPALAWEGAALPALPSYRGEVTIATNDLRDPAVFLDSDGKRYVVYSGGGEQALGIARFLPRTRGGPP